MLYTDEIILLTDLFYDNKFIFQFVSDFQILAEFEE